jgi:hypothetical protein
MDALERIRSIIAGFAGYADGERRRLSDEQLRGFVGEVLAELPESEIDRLSPQDRSCYDRVLLRCEFVNQHVFHAFDTDPTPQRVAATLQADLGVIEMTHALRSQTGEKLDGALCSLNQAFDKRDAAMQQA